MWSISMSIWIGDNESYHVCCSTVHSALSPELCGKKTQAYLLAILFYHVQFSTIDHYVVHNKRIFTTCEAIKSKTTKTLLTAAFVITTFCLNQLKNVMPSTVFWCEYAKETSNQYCQNEGWVLVREKKKNNKWIKRENTFIFLL